MKPSKLEDTWSISTLDAYPIPPQALPVVLEQYKKRVESGVEITIRQAKWTARLSGIKNSKINISTLIDLITKTEQLCEIAGQKQADLRIFDKLLSGLEATGEEGKLPMAFWASASLAGILKGDPTKPIRQSDINPIAKGKKISKEEALGILDKQKLRKGQ